MIFMGHSGFPGNLMFHMSEKPLKRYLFASDFDQTLTFDDSGYVLSELDGYHFDFYVISASPVEVIQSALEGIVPRDHIYGTEFVYNAAGEIESLVRATAGYGKVAALDQLQAALQIGPDHIIYTGDGSSDINVMLHVKMRDGFTIAVSEAKHISQVARRTVLSTNALAVLGPILEETVGWERAQIRQFFESYGILIQEWDSVRTDWLTLRPAVKDATQAA